MKMVKKYRVLLILVLVVLSVPFFFFYRTYQKDINLLDAFLVSYQKSENAISNFSQPVFASILNDSSGIYNRMIDSMKSVLSEGNRLSIIKKVRSLNTYLLNSLDNTGDLESKASVAIKELNLNAIALSGISSLIKNDGELRSTSAEIAFIAMKELDTLKTYKKEIRNKIDEVSRLLENKEMLTNESSRLINSLKQKSNFESLSDEFSNLNRTRKIAYAHFKQLSG